MIDIPIRHDRLDVVCYIQGHRTQTCNGTIMHRLREPELMDDPCLDERLHLEALAGLERLNFWSSSTNVLWKPISAISGGTDGRPLRVLDIATGGGDMPIRLWQLSRKSNIDIHIDGCDISDRAVEYAAERANRAGAQVRFFRLDALTEEIPGEYDVIVSSLFFHHLDEDQAVVLLSKMSKAATSAVLVNDLERSRLNLALVSIASNVLSRSSVVHHDGPASVRAAFTLAEMRMLADGAGMPNCSISRRWPCRFLLKWTRQQ